MPASVAAGADLYLLDIDEENLAATAREAQACGGAVKTLVCDLTQSAAISAAVSAVLAEWGALNILVNNAGIAHYGATHEMSAAQWERLMSLNLLAPIQITRAFIPTLLAQDEAHVLNICSIFGLVPLRRGAAYQVSKFGLVGLSAALRAEYGRDLGVTALCPGFVRTTLLDTLASDDSGNPRSPVPDWLAARPEKVAAVAIRAIRTNRALVVITPLARFIWWIARLSPGRLSCWPPRLVGWLANPRWRNKRAAGQSAVDLGVVAATTMLWQSIYFPGAASLGEPTKSYGRDGVLWHSGFRSIENEHDRAAPLGTGKGRKPIAR